MNNPVKLGKPVGDAMNAGALNRKGLKVSGKRSSVGKPVACFGLMVLLTAASLSACGKPPALINRYVLDYPPPATARLSPLATAIKVELFSVAEALNRPEMVYKETPYQTGVYRYNRWRTDPGYLVTDYLTRDLRDSRLFKAVFPYDRSGSARFHLEGGVAEFQENDQPGPWKAALALNVTLLDTDQENIADRVVFQRNYQVQEPMLSKTPQGLAEAMSAALEKASKRIIEDVYRAVQGRLAQEAG